MSCSVLGGIRLRLQGRGIEIASPAKLCDDGGGLVGIYPNFVRTTSGGGVKVTGEGVLHVEGTSVNVSVSFLTFFNLSFLVSVIARRKSTLSSYVFSHFSIISLVKTRN